MRRGRAARTRSPRRRRVTLAQWRRAERAAAALEQIAQAITREDAATEALLAALADFLDAVREQIAAME